LHHEINCCSLSSKVWSLANIFTLALGESMADQSDTDTAIGDFTTEAAARQTRQSARAQQDTTGWNEQAVPTPSRVQVDDLSLRLRSLTAKYDNLERGLANLHLERDKLQKNQSSAAAPFGGGASFFDRASSELRSQRHLAERRENSSDEDDEHQQHPAAASTGTGLLPGFSGFGRYPNSNTSGLPDTGTALRASAKRRAEQITAGHSSSNCNDLTGALRSGLEDLKADGKLKPRNIHELKTLFAIVDTDSLTEVHKLINNRLSELYIAAARGWTEVKNFQRQNVDSLLGLQPAPQSTTVRFAQPQRKQNFKKKANNNATKK
jgi:hypothetical protein